MLKIDGPFVKTEQCFDKRPADGAPRDGDKFECGLHFGEPLVNFDQRHSTCVIDITRRSEYFDINSQTCYLC